MKHRFALRLATRPARAVLAVVIAILFTSPSGGQCDYWQPLGSGTNNRPLALLSAGDVLYAGGTFTTAGGNSANYVARWSGATWSNLGTGLDDQVSELCMYNNELVAGGQFLTAGGVTVNRIARWNGSTWSAMGTGFSAQVNSMTVYNGQLIAAGNFLLAGGTLVNRIARWDGAQWLPLGTGMNDIVYTVTVHNGELYAGGPFTTAGGTAVNRIARWNGSAWQAVGTGVTGNDVVELTVYNNQLIACGDFSHAGGVLANGIARWTGSAWQALGTGLGEQSAQAATVHNGELVVCGSFDSAGGVAVNHIARWNGSVWKPLNSGLEGSSVNSVASFKNELVAGGGFTTAGGDPISYIAKWVVEYVGWRAGPLDTLSASANGPVYASVNWDPDGIGLHAQQLVVAGNFTQIGDVAAQSVAVWDTMSWKPLGSGLLGTVRSLTVFNNQIYAGGDFILNGTPLGVAVFNGSNWVPLPGNQAMGGVSPRVNAVTIYNNQLHAAGVFTSMGGVPANNIARWTGGVGGVWQALGLGIGATINPEVHALQVFSSNLYVGGTFTSAGGSTATNIARWDGSAWTTVGSVGANGPVYALALQTDPTVQLIAGGAFTTMNNGSVAANRIARFSGTTWSALGSGLDGTALTVRYDSSTQKIFAGGTFSNAGGVPVTNIARWNISTLLWEAIGSGAQGGAVRCLNSFTRRGSYVVVGGDFTNGGGTGEQRLAGIAASTWAKIVCPQLGYALTTYNNMMICAGGIGDNTANGPASSVIAWDGVNSWRFGDGLNDYAYGITSYTPFGAPEPWLVAGGDFTHSGQAPVNYIARWIGGPETVGGTWQTIGEGLNAPVFGVRPFLSYLVAVGEFTGSAYGTFPNLNRIARWDNQNATWLPMTTGTNDYVWGTAIRPIGFGDSSYQLIVGGGFTTAGGLAANKIAVWTESTTVPNSGSWSTLGAGFNDDVVAIEVHPPGNNGPIYAGGWLTQSGATPLGHIARWNGSAWVPAGNFNGPVFMLKSVGGYLYAGGNFTMVDGKPIKGLARYTGTQWEPVSGSIVDGQDALAALTWNGELHVAGRYTRVGLTNPALTTPGWARYSATGLPWIAYHQPDQWQECGLTVGFSINVAPGHDDFTYQWRKDGVPLTDGPTGTGSTIFGADQNVMIIVDISTADMGEYECALLLACTSIVSTPSSLEVVNCCDGDVSGDKTVGVPDLLTIINGWGPCPVPPANCDADVAPPGGDGTVGVPDLLAIINGWGACP